MTHTIVTLQYERFYTRTALGKTLVNIGGITHECTVEVRGNRQACFKLRSVETNEVLCDFCSWHMHGGPDMYQIEGATHLGSDATLLVFPTLEQWNKEHNTDEEDDEE